MQHLLQISNRLNLNKFRDLLLALGLWLGHDGLLRVGEVVSGIRGADVEWLKNRKEAKIYLPRTKTCQTGHGVFVHLIDYGGINATYLLRKVYDKGKFARHPSRLLFPSLKGSRKSTPKDWNAPASKQWLRNGIKMCTTRIGLDSSQYSGHSLRSGGATDLFNMKVPYYVIKRMGRWKSDAVLIYYRDEENIHRTVYKAYKRLRRSVHKEMGEDLRGER